VRKGPNRKVQPMVITKLSHEFLAATITLVNKVFAYEASTTNLPERALRASLNPEENQALFKDQGVRKVAYYVALDDATEKVLGVIGQYEEDGDPPEIVWVGWFCVDPAYRGHHVGEALLTWNMQNARENGYTTMRLYTSDHPREQAAQGLYQNLGFEVTRVQPLEGTEYHIIYRERQL
jgi:ribosomal protein S18 acetylase RimI-like enzyme